MPSEVALRHDEKRTFTLPPEHVVFIEAQVASGSYASASDVVRAGLQALQERDAAEERWLKEEVAPVYDAMQADPGRAQTLDAVFATIRARNERRTSVKAAAETAPQWTAVPEGAGQPAE
jgi:antitoxin ParD1/3/4